jgi:ABC-2 type transport system permease protein
MNRFAALYHQRLRRDGLQLTLWIGSTALLAYAAYVGVGESFGTEQDRRVLLVAAIANPVILLFRGLPSGASDGAFIAFLIVPFLCMLAAFMSSFLAVRHTRADEETGRAELVGGTPAGRMLPTVVTLVHGLIANLVLALLTAAALIAAGLEPQGSFVVGSAAAVVGVFFLGLGLLAAQFMRTSRGANTVSVAVLLVTYLLAGIGNALGTPSDDLQRMESSWLTWLSPFGWAENSRPFADDNVWPLVLCKLVGIALAVVAIALQRVRDVGSSFVAERAGRVDARSALGSTTALVWRLSAGSIIGWAIGGALSGLLATTLASVVEEISAENASIQAVLDQMMASQGSLEQGLLTTFFVMIGILAACAGVQTITRARQEETHGTAELVLATPIGRVRWLADFIVVGFAAIVTILAAGVGAASIGVALNDGDPDLYRSAVTVGLGQVVAASVFLVTTALVFVLAPRWTIAVGWGLVLLAAVIGLFGPIFGMPDSVTWLSPVAAAPVPVADGVEVRGLWGLLGAIAIAGVAALGFMRRRELAADG